MPFAALKGFEDALLLKESQRVMKVELTEDSKQELDRQFAKLKVGHMATIDYYHEGEYVRIKGLVAKIDVSAKILRIVDTRIPFDDIYRIRSEEKGE